MKTLRNAVAGGLLGSSLALAAPDPALFPRPADYTLMHWAGGFPGSVKGAPWRRVIETGHYAFALDTDTMRIPHFGAWSTNLGYAEAAARIPADWQSLPPAELDLTLTADGTVYTCTAGGAWTTHGGPRLIESGRFVQRADVTNLVFTREGGAALNVEARFETVAWPDRLALILVARPGVRPGTDSTGQREAWADASIGVRLRTGGKEFARRAGLRAGGGWSEAGILLDPTTMQETAVPPAVRVTAQAQAVTPDPLRGWHRILLDGLKAEIPAGDGERRNDALQRVRLVLENGSDREETARLLLEKNDVGAGVGIGSPVTGLSALLRDASGEPTGLPVQLSKNWHTRPEGGVFAGQWFHGFTQIRLPPRSRTELEFTLSHGHWGGLPAASHAQLCLIGWGSNQLWDEAALGAWGESICFEPDQAQAGASILDVRPLLVTGMSGGQWQWTHNVGGGDHVRIFTPDGTRLRHARQRTAYLRQGPCLTEVLYAGRAGDAIEHRLTASLARTDDLVRAVFHLRMQVEKDQPFSRLVLFQIGADTYSYTGERKMAAGNADGLLREWSTQWGGAAIRTGPVQLTGSVPWISLHEAEPRREKGQAGAWANRGLVLREWKARLGGREAAPWMVERGVRACGKDTSTADLVPPPDVTALRAGDFVEAVIELLVPPQQASDYYGPNAALREALQRDGNTWKLVQREAAGNRRKVTVTTGTLVAAHPAVHIAAAGDRAAFTLKGGLAYVPVCISGLTRPDGHRLRVNGGVLNQGVHGNDFWQADHDPATRTWSLTYQVPAPSTGALQIDFE